MPVGGRISGDVDLYRDVCTEPEPLLSYVPVIFRMEVYDRKNLNSEYVNKVFYKIISQ